MGTVRGVQCYGFAVHARSGVDVAVGFRALGIGSDRDKLRFDAGGHEHGGHQGCVIIAIAGWPGHRKQVGGPDDQLGIGRQSEGVRVVLVLGEGDAAFDPPENLLGALARATGAGGGLGGGLLDERVLGGLAGHLPHQADGARRGLLVIGWLRPDLCADSRGIHARQEVLAGWLSAHHVSMMRAPTNVCAGRFTLAYTTCQDGAESSC